MTINILYTERFNRFTKKTYIWKFTFWNIQRESVKPLPGKTTKMG